MNLRLERGLGAGVLVAAISSSFGVLLLAATAYLGAALDSDPALAGSRTLDLLLAILSVVLLGLALYVAGVVAANTFSTIVAGRIRQIALLRLLGASAASQRKAISRSGLGVGLVGAVLGTTAGVILAHVLRTVADDRIGRAVPVELLSPTLLLPGAAVTITTWCSAWVGSRRVLNVTALQAVSVSVEAGWEAAVRRPVRHTVALLLVVAGAALLALGLLVGLASPLGVLVAFAGGVLSFTGIAVGAVLVVPPVLRLVGRAFGGAVPARLAAENALRHPERSSRMAIGVVIGVTLVTTITVAMESMRKVLTETFGGTMPAEADTALTTVATVMSALVAVSAVIAAVGLVNLLTLGVVQRRRELGLLRTLGLSTRQVRAMVLLEAAHVTVTAVLIGLVLGIFYGWAGAQATFGSAHEPGARSLGHLVTPAIPWWPVAVIAGATAVLTLVAAVTPTRLATRVTPVAALADA
ncbi:MAG: FtsX-like permease family protein [Luteolibacter sp.]